MECKLYSPTTTLTMHSELIDTLWNVNESLSPHISAHSRELIDTLWNVNKCYHCAVAINSNRINRYIMECK